MTEILAHHAVPLGDAHPGASYACEVVRAPGKAPRVRLQLLLADSRTPVVFTLEAGALPGVIAALTACAVALEKLQP